MSFRSATVFIDQSPETQARLQTAIALAQPAGAHLDAAAVLAEPPFTYIAGAELAVETWSEEIALLRTEAASLARDAQARIAAAGLSGGARGDTAVIGAVAELAALNARYSDLAILGQPVPGDAQDLTAELLDGALFHSGRPVLIIPASGAPGAEFSRIVIAWDGGKEAARAINDAMPFLAAAEKVSLAMVEPQRGTPRAGAEPGADMALQLARHGVTVSVDRLPDLGTSISETISRHITDFGAGMLVMGGYGHSKLRESVFGGVTRDLLGSCPVPLFMAH